MKIPHRPSRRLLAASAVLLTVAAASVVAGRYSAPDTAPAPAPAIAAAPSPAAQESAVPYTASVHLEVVCGPFPSARVTVTPTPGGHPDLHLEIGQVPYTGAPQHIFNSVTQLDLTTPAHPVTLTVPVEQAATVSVYTKDTSVNLPLQQDLSCPQWADQGAPNHP